MPGASRRLRRPRASLDLSGRPLPRGASPGRRSALGQVLVCLAFIPPCGLPSGLGHCPHRALHLPSLSGHPGPAAEWTLVLSVLWSGGGAASGSPPWALQPPCLFSGARARPSSSLRWVFSKSKATCSALGPGHAAFLFTAVSVEGPGSEVLPLCAHVRGPGAALRASWFVSGACRVLGGRRLSRPLRPWSPASPAETKLSLGGDSGRVARLPHEAWCCPRCCGAAERTRHFWVGRLNPSFSRAPASSLPWSRGLRLAGR